MGYSGTGQGFRLAAVQCACGLLVRCDWQQCASFSDNLPPYGGRHAFGDGGPSQGYRFASRNNRCRVGRDGRGGCGNGGRVGLRGDRELRRRDRSSLPGGGFRPSRRGGRHGGGAFLGEGAWMQANASLGYGVVIERGRVLAPGEAVSR